MSLLRTKSVEQSIADTDEPAHRLKRELGALDLTVFGVGVIIGTGIFVLTGEAAGTLAGPAVALSFVVSAVACGLAALCYAAFASTCRWRVNIGTLFAFVLVAIGVVVLRRTRPDLQRAFRTPLVPLSRSSPCWRRCG